MTVHTKANLGEIGTEKRELTHSLGLCELREQLFKCQQTYASDESTRCTESALPATRAVGGVLQCPARGGTMVLVFLLV